MPRFQRVKNDIDQLNEQAKEIEKRAQNLESNINEAHKKLDGYNTQSITVLSIFTAVVFAFTGSATLLGSAFTSIDSVSKYRLIFLVVLISVALFNVIYAFLVLVAKMVDKEIPEAKGKNCEDRCPCSNNCRPICRARTRHPFVFLFNILAFLILAVLFYLWGVEYKGWPFF